MPRGRRHAVQAILAGFQIRKGHPVRNGRNSSSQLCCLKERGCSRPARLHPSRQELHGPSCHRAVTARAIDGAEVPTGNARELHEFLEVKTPFRDWIKQRIKQYGFKEGVDYVRFELEAGMKMSENGGEIGGIANAQKNAALESMGYDSFGQQGRIEYELTLNMAKETSAQFSAGLPDACGRPQPFLTMSSREIAELCEKEHKNVMADIRAMFEQLEMTKETSAQFCADLPDACGRPQPVFNLPKDLTMTLVAGYNVKLRKRIIDRWLELEGKTAIAIPQTLPEALRLALALPGFRLKRSGNNADRLFLGASH